MVSTRKLLGWVKNPKRLLSLVTRRARMGRHIQINPLSSVPKGYFENETFRETLSQIRVNWGKRFSTKKNEVLLAKARTLQKSIMLQHKTGRKPNVYQVLALNALSKGLESPELKLEAGRLRRFRGEWKNKTPFEGDSTDIYKALQIGLVSKVENILYASREKAVTSQRIAQLTGLDWSKKKNQDYVNATMQLLEVCGLVKKMPQRTTPEGTSLSVWAHAAYKNPGINYRNVQVEIINELYSGSQRGVKVFSQQHFQGKFDTVTRDTKLFFAFMRRHLAELQQAGLVTFSENRQGKQVRFQAELTPVGHKLWKKYVVTGNLPEPLRKILLRE